MEVSGDEEENEKDDTYGSCSTVVFQPHEGELEHTLCCLMLDKMHV